MSKKPKKDINVTKILARLANEKGADKVRLNGNCTCINCSDRTFGARAYRRWVLEGKV